MAWELVPSQQTRKLRKLEKQSTKIAKSQTNLSGQYMSLTTAKDQIVSTITELKTRDFSQHKKLINEMNITEDYKERLNTDLERSRDMAIKTLEPLLETAEKLRGNMIVTQEKSLQFLAVIKAQRIVAAAGEIQVEVLTQLQNNGTELAVHINDLLSKVEEINNVTQSAIAPFKHTGGGMPSKSLLDFNPIVGNTK